MGYSAEVIQRARARLEQARADREAENRQHLETAYREVPRIRQIDQQLRQTMASAMQAAFAKGTDVRQAMDAIRGKFGKDAIAFGSNGGKQIGWDD